MSRLLLDLRTVQPGYEPRQLTVDANATDTISDVKSKIAPYYKTVPSNIRLILKGEILEDKKH